jgi:transcriptional regulator of acetoin/glycerol metabolism
MTQPDPDFETSPDPLDDDVTTLPPELVEEILAWDWPGENARQLARDLCAAVADAEELEHQGSDPETERYRLAQGRWRSALDLADLLRRATPEPYPPAVEDCLARIDAAVDVRALRFENYEE